MNISEQELRAMVREAIARNTPGERPAAPATHQQSGRTDPSHGLLTLVGGGDSEGRCVIEPAVACTHCGYCQSMGH